MSGRRFRRARLGCKQFHDEAAPTDTFSEREVAILRLLAGGYSNKEIARAMQVGEATVKWHVKNLFAKLDAGTRKQVVLRARILGLLAPEG